MQSSLERQGRGNPMDSGICRPIIGHFIYQALTLTGRPSLHQVSTILFGIWLTSRGSPDNFLASSRLVSPAENSNCWAAAVRNCQVIFHFWPTPTPDKFEWNIISHLYLAVCQDNKGCAGSISSFSGVRVSGDKQRRICVTSSALSAYFKLTVNKRDDLAANLPEHGQKIVEL